MHTYESPGCYSITLTTSAACGNPSKDSKKLSYCTKGGWQNTQTLNLPARASSVAMVDENKIWAYSYKSLYFSEDNGQSFTERRFKKTPLTNMENIIGFYFKGERGLVIFSSRSSEGKFNRVYITSDYGNTWHESIEVPNSQLNFSVSNNTIALYSNMFDNKIFFSISEDFGKTWRELNFQLSGSIRYLYMFDEKNLIVHISNGVSNDSIQNLYLSTDVGQNWNKRDIPLNLDKAPIDINHIYITTPDKKIFLIRDSLRHIQNIVLPYSPEFLVGIIFKDINHGYVVGSNAIFYTKDGGMSWEERHCHNINLGKFTLDHNNEFYSINTENIYRYIPEYRDPECLFSSSYYLRLSEYIKIYPNPVYSGHDIFIEQSGKSSLQIEITDQVGRFVVRSIISEQSVSTLRIPYLLPGTYFIRISDIEKGTQVVKLLIII